MLIIENNKIYITKGDDAVIDVDITIDGSAYPMQPGDVLTLTVRARPEADSPVLLETTGEAGGTQLALTHEKTARLEVGQYSADIQLTTAEGRRITLWPTPEGSARRSTSNSKTFNVMPEVTDT